MSWNLALQFNKFASITRVSGNDILIYNASGTKLASYKTTGLFLGDADAGGASAGGNNLVLPSYGSLTWGGITATPPSILSGGGTSMYYRGGTHYIQNTAGTSKGVMDFALATYVNSANTVVIDANGVADLPYHINNNNSVPSYYLPDARTTPIGNTYTFNNNSTNSLILRNNTGASVIYNATAGSVFQVVQLTNATQNGTWDAHAFLPSNVNWGTSGCSYAGNMTITGATHKLSVQGTHLGSGAGNEGGNIVLGNSASGNNITAGGINNTIIGTNAGNALTSGNSNTLVGDSAGLAVNTGAGNVCVGTNSGNTITTAYNNVCVGNGAGVGLTNGGSGVYIGLNALPSAGSANGEIVIGSATGKGSSTTKIGQTTTSCYLPSTNYINDYNVANTNNAEIVMTGANGTPMRIVVANSIIYIGNNLFNTGVSMASGASAWSPFSDRRLKENIEPLDSSLSALLQLNPVSFNFIGNIEKLTKDVGFIAQEVADIPLLKNITSLSLNHKGEERYTLATTDFIPYLVKGIQEQQTKINSLEAQLASLKATVDALVASTGHLVI